MPEKKPDMANRLNPKGKIHLHSQFADYHQGKPINPINVEISPSGACTASCGFCFYANTGELGDHRKVFLPRDVLVRLLDDCKDMGVKSISWTGGGDPALHPDIDKITTWSKVCGISQGMFTNSLTAPRFDPSYMDWIRVTMTDKPYKEEYIRALRPAKTLGFAFNYAGPQDDAYLKETLDLAGRVGADYVQLRPALQFHGKTVDITPPSFVHPLLHITDYKFEQAKIPHGTEYKQCEGYHFIPFVWEDGNVDVCSYMRKHEGYTLGNLHKESFRSIMARAPKFVPVHPNCQVCCRNHEINLEVSRARKMEDINFP